MFKYECGVGHVFVISGVGYDGLLWGIMYVEWYGACNFLVFSVVDYGCVYVFHVCFDLYIVYGVGFVLMSVV